MMASGVAGATWRPFLRALADEIEATMEPEFRRAMLRSVGRRMAAMMPLPEAGSLEVLELEMNDALAVLGWGQVSFALHEGEHLLLTHTGLPRLGTAGDPPGSWLAPTLEGLYDGWMAQQPGAAEQNLAVRLTPGTSATTAVFRYGQA